jgi:glucuronoarabinoxylan endo-1,4-beta-xylanase
LFFLNGPGQIGLTFLRTDIASDGTLFRGAYSNLTKAAARGALIWATPWTGPAAWKDNGSETGGGHLLVINYDDWATRLAGFQANIVINAGVTLYALSIQNEPDFTASYESMLYTTAEMTNFVKVLGPKLAALSPRPRLILAEPAAASLNPGYVSAVQADGTAAPYLDICAWHQYGGTTSAIAGHTNWQTEMSSFEAFDGSMANALTVAGWIHDCIANSQVNAWHWWWIYGHDASNQGLIGDNNDIVPTTKRFFVMGNFSKFVRPGYVRVGTLGTVSGVSLTAYRNPSNGQCVLVAINTNGTTVTKQVGLLGLGSTPPTMTPHITDASNNLVTLSTVPVVRNIFTASLAPNSVTTFTGTGV